MALLLNECSIIRSNGRRWSESFQTSLRFCATVELSRRNDVVYVGRADNACCGLFFFAPLRRVGSFDRLAQRFGCSAVRSFDCSVVWLFGVPSFSIECYSAISHFTISHSTISHSTISHFTISHSTINFRLFFRLLPFFYYHLYIFTFVPCVFYRSRFPFVRLI